MDTRTKIIDCEQAVEFASKQPARWVTGHFDPLLAGHARSLHAMREEGRLLIVVITNSKSAGPLLPQRARAELVAALGDVDYVVLKNGPMDDADDDRISRRFIDHVVQRHNEAVR